MAGRRARINDALALLTAIVVIAFDQWTKSLVVAHLSPPNSRSPIPLIGDYLTIYYIQNSGAAFGLFANTVVLVLLIVGAVAVIAYLYWRIVNTGSLAYKLIFGLIIGGAAGNLLDRVHHGGYVVDFIWFRIPQVNYSFAVFNLADASISVGVILLFFVIVIGGMRHTSNEREQEQQETSKMHSSGALRSTEQDAQT